MRFAVRVPALLAAAALTAASPPPADPLAAVAAANGHAALVHVHSITEGTAEGRHVELTIDRLGESRLVRRCVADVCSGSWFDGKRRWTYGLNDVLLPDDDDPDLTQRRTLAAITSYAFAEPAFRAAGGTVAAAGPSAWLVRAPGGAPLTAFLDPATRSLRRVTAAAGETVAEYDGERHVGAARFPVPRTGREAFGLDGATAVSGPIVPPAGAAVTFAGTANLTLGNDPVPIVPCSLGGRSARCLIDTGATPSAITLPLAEALGLEPRGELELSGFGRMVTGYVDATALAVGQARFARVRLAVVPQSTAAKFDVVLGADLLARVRVWLDRRRGIGSIDKPLADAAGTHELTPFPAIALRFTDGTPHVDVTIAGGATQRALFDTGDQSVVSFGYAQYRQGPQWPLVERLQALGLGGVDDAFAVTVPTVNVGGLALGPTRATVRRTQVMPHVGIGIWARGVVELDEGAGVVVIQSR
jgi:Aspartyl protease